MWQGRLSCPKRPPLCHALVSLMVPAWWHSCLVSERTCDNVGRCSKRFLFSPTACPTACRALSVFAILRCFHQRLVSVWSALAAETRLAGIRHAERVLCVCVRVCLHGVPLTCQQLNREAQTLRPISLEADHCTQSLKVRQLGAETHKVNNDHKP